MLPWLSPPIFLDDSLRRHFARGGHERRRAAAGRGTAARRNNQKGRGALAGIFALAADGHGGQAHGGVVAVGQLVVLPLLQRALSVAHLHGRRNRRAGVALIGDFAHGNRRVVHGLGRDFEIALLQRQRVVGILLGQRAEGDAIFADALARLPGEPAREGLALHHAAIGRLQRGFALTGTLALAALGRERHRPGQNRRLNFDRRRGVMLRLRARKGEFHRDQVAACRRSVEVHGDRADGHLVALMDAVQLEILRAQLDSGRAVVDLLRALRLQRDAQRLGLARAADRAHAV